MTPKMKKIHHKPEDDICKLKPYGSIILFGRLAKIQRLIIQQLAQRWTQWNFHKLLVTHKLLQLL